MLIIPAIDLKDGKCVRLKQGRMEDDTVFSDDPVATAQHWVDEGARRLHLVDLNGAFAGTPIHKPVVEAIARAQPELPIQIGGGIRSLETIEHYLDAGVSFVIIGTKAVKEPEFVEEANGKGTVETYTVINSREGPTKAIIIGRLENGKRFVANTKKDDNLLNKMMQNEMLNTKGTIKFENSRNIFQPD